MLTAIYGAMHFLVDFICAWAMFSFFQSGEGAYLNFLIYNFCAFALQMPIGALMDLLTARAGALRRKWLAFACAGAGAAVTVLGALVNPALLGLGNALFHVGGGLDVIAFDFRRDHGGRDLGIFVAPGAVGLYFGTRLGKSGASWLPLILAGAVLIVLLTWLGMLLKKATLPEMPHAAAGKGNIPILVICCFVVVILRSFTGFAATFDWKNQVFLGFLAVLATALGKAAGGFLSARFGPGKTMTVTLLLAGACFLWGEHPVFGIAALLLFNMSMPVTLYLLARYLPGLPGFSFGLLTFGLFLGFLPIYAGAALPVSGSVIGAVGSAVSAGLLLLGWKAVNHDRVSA